MFRRLSNLLFLLILLTGCGASKAAPSAPTVDVNAIHTATVLTVVAGVTQTMAFATPAPDANLNEEPQGETPEAPTPAPTPTIEVILEPVTGAASDNLTVRSEPRRGSANLGGIFINQKISVLARNPQASWYYIQWKDAPTGYAWIVSRGVELEGADLTRLPIAEYGADGSLILRPPVLWEISGEPQPIPPVPSGDKVRPATVAMPANIRVCPSLGCMTLALLQPGQAINMTGRYGDNEWAQFDYPSGPDGKAWIASSAIQTGPDGFGGLPYFDVLGLAVTPEAPTPTPDPNITPTITNTPRPTPAGPLARLEADASLYAEPNSLSAQTGILKSGDEIYITGISLIGEWYQIQYPAFTEGRAYISRKGVRILGDARFLPYFDDKGNLLPTP